ncbi:MAG: molecular chaperone SurA [Gallionella sp.]|nr:molecular chaperone SurA [Gallionella sp.]OIO11716.1 MAG: molecular chaperone SurA [Gallionellaceae bacterium CG1_02_60_325]PIR09631.1 MAG: molecular chaperone SurA [Gallionellaceae bacterium CG11_big_fil_rev_8_21_14_0_20_60_62]PIV47978.1 MAG: molecular chaperone SurA [Gallionellaceae bacterium CG02_land_8_20_14_3_00_60_115]PJC05212.1 MAG: molecular chaperone SurA [Gallionellaceae bacterium CG_4_9_14_0_8_um_filter_60_335]
MPNKRILIGLLCAVCAGPLPAMAAAIPLDTVRVVVNDGIITRLELVQRMRAVVQQLQRQGTRLPESGILEKQMLERMIQEKLLLQFAKENGVRVDEAQLESALQRIAQQNNFPSLAAFRQKLEADGIDFPRFREEIRGEMLTSRLREREVDSKLFISDSDIEAYLDTQALQGKQGEQLQLAHILIVVPEQATADNLRNLQRRAEEALQKMRDGATFAQIAAGYSDARDALQGGMIGWRPRNELPALFADALAPLQPGQLTGILRSPSGFHLLKLLDRRNDDAPVFITQTRARHILIKTSELVSENDARDRLQAIKRSIDAGADFAEQARLHSEDGSAAQGGELGWISPGETVPEFETAMNALKEKQTSGLVKSGFGWHLIQVLARRSADVSEQQKKQQARNAIRAYKSDEAYQDWLRQLRDRAFIEYRE